MMDLVLGVAFPSLGDVETIVVWHMINHQACQANGQKLEVRQIEKRKVSWRASPSERSLLPSSSMLKEGGEYDSP